MKVPKMKLALVALFTVFLLPNSSHASTAVAANDNTGIFLVKFQLEAPDTDYRIPIGAQYGLTTAKSPAFVGYKLFIGDTEVTEVEKSGAIVLSNAPVVNGMYEIKAGNKASFTLVSIVTVTDQAPSSSNYHTEITKLPYFRDGVRTQMSESTLLKYDFESDTIRLNKFD